LCTFALRFRVSTSSQNSRASAWRYKCGLSVRTAGLKSSSDLRTRASGPLIRCDLQTGSELGCLGQAVGLSIGGEVSAERGGAELVLLPDRGLELVQRVGRHRREARQLACAARARATRRRRSLPRDAFLALLVQPSTTSHSIRHLSRCDGCKILVDLLLVYKVTLAQTNPMPAEIRAELRLRLYEVATTLADMPADHGVWESMEDSEVQIDVRGWQFFYRVDPTARRITVLRGGPSST